MYCYLPLYLRWGERLVVGGRDIKARRGMFRFVYQADLPPPNEQNIALIFEGDVQWFRTCDDLVLFLLSRNDLLRD